MHLRQAYADTLRLLRARKGLNQSDVASALDASHISRLENARSGVTLDTSESLAQTLKLHPLSLLVMAYAVKEKMTPGDALRVVTNELTSLSYLDVKLADEIPAPQHPLLAQGAKTRQAVQALKAQGVKKAEIAGRLGVSGATVRRYWHSADT
ncbi:MAG: helix-turn-helix domain-containing protein [Pseudomonas oryzihabitans]|uniref:helix-turn-helix domain-containing protein n=1 Tax=Pseudomonas oryzihabitans TaxID=47885 RepID=UPI002913A580|nr:helix-turn-helix domain-containing protein [Pseudomonas oryzihabitans]MDU4058629.1 helix-turn-helix domain-containing protein [Pseudomonas oryzihabitans]